MGQPATACCLPFVTALLGRSGVDPLPGAGLSGCARCFALLPIFPVSNVFFFYLPLPPSPTSPIRLAAVQAAVRCLRDRPLYFAHCQVRERARASDVARPVVDKTDGLTVSAFVRTHLPCLPSGRRGLGSGEKDVLINRAFLVPLRVLRPSHFTSRFCFVLFRNKTKSHHYEGILFRRPG